MILSASRRTDIPGYYSEWFINRLKEGYLLTKNPMNPSQVSRIMLSPEIIDCIIFWTKDPIRMLDQLPQLDVMRYHYYFQFTLTPYGTDIEKRLRDKKDIMKTFQQLSTILGQDRVLWRYDPILLNDELTIDYHILRFTEYCKELQGYTKICTISFVDRYSKLNKPVTDRVIQDITEDQMHQLAYRFSEIGKEFDIELRACCEKLDFTEDGIRPAACIDKDIIERISGRTINKKKDRNQRSDCGCMQSVDVGIYNTCKNGCIYCYANHSEASIQNNFQAHNPGSNILIGSVDKNLKIKDRI